MQNDFSRPQRQSAVGILVMFFDTIQQYGRALWPVVLISVYRLNNTAPVYLYSGIAILLAIVAVIGYLRYLNFTFFLDNENQEFVVTEGILNKTKTTILLDKIQQVNLKQSFIQKIIGVYALDVDTAGSQSKEVSNLAISHQLALELKTRLLENYKNGIQANTTDEVVIPTTEDHPLVKIGFLSLLKMGITSNYVRSFLLLIAFFSSMYENLRNFISEDAIDEDKITGFIDKSSTFQAITFLILLIFVVILLMNVIRIVFKYFDFKVTRQTGSLLLSFGLLNTKSTIIKPEKVQITSVTQNFFKRR